MEVKEGQWREDTMTLQKVGLRQGSVHNPHALNVVTQYLFFHSFTHILSCTQLLQRLLCSANGINECNSSHRLISSRATAVDSRHRVKYTGVKCDKIVTF